MSVILAFLFGCVAGSLVTQYWPWVRGALGAARDRVFGARPARAEPTPTQELVAAANATTRTPAKPVNWTRALSNILGFFGKLIGWCIQHPILAVAALVLIVVVVWRPFAPVIDFVRCPFGGAGILWCSQTKAELREALKDERDNTRIAELEARVGALSAQLAENSANDRRRVDRIVAQANEDIDNAVEAVDPDQLYRVYRDAYDRVWNDLSPADEPNPAPRGSDQVRRADGSPI